MAAAIRQVSLCTPRFAQRFASQFLNSIIRSMITLFLQIATNFPKQSFEHHLIKLRASVILPVVRACSDEFEEPTRLSHPCTLTPDRLKD